MKKFFQSIKKILNSLYNRDRGKDDDKKLHNNKKSNKKDIMDEEGAKEPINNDMNLLLLPLTLMMVLVPLMMEQIQM